jgi:predicted HTH transcriptional regulator
MDLTGLLRRSEGKTLEYKRDLSSPEGVLRTFVAFANTAGGTLLVGVEDGTKRVRGIQDVLGAEERIANIISDGIRPRLIPDIEIIPWRNLQLIAVQIYPSNTRPHYLVRLGQEEGVFIRVGSTNRRADQAQIEELRRLNRIGSFDEQPLLETSLEDLDAQAVRDAFSSIRQLSAAAFRTLRLTTEHQGKSIPTIGGILLFGKERLQRFPDAWVKAGRFNGTDRAKLIDAVEIRSYLPKAAEEAIDFVQKHSRQEVLIGKVRRREIWSVPPVAVREAVMNAIVHMDYAQQGSPVRLAMFDDRVEVDNPGLLPFGLTIEDIRRGVSKLRNRVIGRVFHELKLVEQWGSGIQRMTAACADAGLPPPVLEEVGTHFRVVISTVRQQKPHMDDREGRIIEALRTNETLSTAQIAELIGMSRRGTRTRLQSLVERGLVIEIGSGVTDPRRKYALPETDG